MCAWRLAPEDRERIRVLVLTLAITIAISVLLKSAIDLIRPCAIIEGVDCPPGYAYPSLHTSTAFSFVFPLIGHPLLPVVYALAALTGWSRILLHAHTWYDIAGGIAVAGFGYNIATSLLHCRGRNSNGGREYARQAVHATLGLVLAAALWQFGIEPLLFPLLLIVLVGTLIIHAKVIGIRVPIIDQLLAWYERDGVLPGEGSFYFGIGVLFTVGLLRHSAAAATAVILVLSLGDALATIVGTRFGRHRLAWNRDKSLEGSIGFAIGGLPALLVCPAPVTLVVIFVATALESLPLQLDDNGTIPIVSSILFYFLI